MMQDRAAIDGDEGSKKKKKKPAFVEKLLSKVRLLPFSSSTSTSFTCEAVCSKMEAIHNNINAEFAFEDSIQEARSEKMIQPPINPKQQNNSDCDHTKRKKNKKSKEKSEKKKQLEAFRREEIEKAAQKKKIDRIEKEAQREFDKATAIEQEKEALEIADSKRRQEQAQFWTERATLLREEADDYDRLLLHRKNKKKANESLFSSSADHDDSWMRTEGVNSGYNESISDDLGGTNSVLGDDDYEEMEDDYSSYADSNRHLSNTTITSTDICRMMVPREWKEQPRSSFSQDLDLDSNLSNKTPSRSAVLREEVRHTREKNIKNEIRDFNIKNKEKIVCRNAKKVSVNSNNCVPNQSASQAVNSDASLLKRELKFVQAKEARRRLLVKLSDLNESLEHVVDILTKVERLLESKQATLLDRSNDDTDDSSSSDLRRMIDRLSISKHNATVKKSELELQIFNTEKDIGKITADLRLMS